MGRELRAAGLDHPSTVIRLGHEPNGTWYPWSTHNDPSLMNAYRRAWIGAHDALRAVCRRVKFTMSLNVSSGGVPAIAGHYPGNPYVDILGLDFYDYAVSRTASAFHSAQGTCGFAEIAAFARARGKRVSLDEWAVGTDVRSTVRDNPFFVRSIYQALSGLQDQYRGIVAYDSYFNSSDDHDLRRNPRAADAYRSLWVPG